MIAEHAQAVNPSRIDMSEMGQHIVEGCIVVLQIQKLPIVAERYCRIAR